MDSTTPSPTSPTLALLANRNFVLLWLGQAISRLGDTVFDFTLLLWIAAVLARQEPWAPLAVSGVLVAQTLPMILVGPVAGVFVDRWDKRRLMLWMDLLRALPRHRRSISWQTRRCQTLSELSGRGLWAV